MQQSGTVCFTNKSLSGHTQGCMAAGGFATKKCFCCEKESSPRKERKYFTRPTSAKIRCGRPPCAIRKQAGKLYARIPFHRIFTTTANRPERLCLVQRAVLPVPHRLHPAVRQPAGAGTVYGGHGNRLMVRHAHEPEDRRCYHADRRRPEHGPQTVLP